MKTAALIVAGGRGTRAARSGAPPKQYCDLGGQPVLLRTVSGFLAHPGIGHVQVVIGAGDEALYRTAVAPVAGKLAAPAVGGASRQASVLAGLEALQALAPEYVLIHDGVRPFVGSDVIDRVIGALGGTDGVIAGIRQTETLKEVDTGGTIVATLPRDNVWRAQTPQGFRFTAILEAHRSARDAGYDDFTDDAAVAEWAGLAISVVEGGQRNVKLTTVEDMDIADHLLTAKEQIMEYRCGTGFDVHRLVEGDHIWLGGVRIPHTHGLEGHSDADVALHALVDAILGAAGAGDIGQHFPPSDPKWKGAASRIFLAAAKDEVVRRGGRIVNADITIVCEGPRIGPYRETMRSTIGGILDIAAERVNIKATTTETLGFTGRREGIAALASATVALPLR